MTAVHIANSICIESKKKNMTNNEIEAPRGKHIACKESKVCMPEVKNKSNYRIFTDSTSTHQDIGRMGQVNGHKLNQLLMAVVL